MMDYGVATFHNTSAALRAEKAALAAGLKVKLIPAPRHISSDCGMVLRFTWADEAAMLAALAAAGVEARAVHHLPPRP